MLDFMPAGMSGELAIAGGIVLLSVIAAWVVYALVGPVMKVLTGKTRTTLDDRFIAAISGPAAILVVLWGLHIAVTSTSYLDDYQLWVTNTAIVLTILVIAYAIRRLVHAVLGWYNTEVAPKTKTDWDERLLPIFDRIATVLIYCVGLLVALSQIGIDINPILASLGIGGLAVALALQPTLSNFFAGAYTVADGSMKAGDHIELDGGPSGTIQEVGWRSTKIITRQGNLLMIPNSKMAESIVTNHQGPSPEINVFVTCGVSYDSDLARVEAVAIDVARQMIAELPEDVVAKDFKPYVRFREFQDSNITFWTVARARSFSATYIVTHELVKRLHARFGQERIEINYPVRKLVYAPLPDQKAPLARGDGRSLN